MSSAPVPPNPAPSPADPAPRGDTGTKSTDRIVVYRHSNLFYWWPVWALGYLFAGITYIDGMYLAIVPDKSVVAEKRKVDVDGHGKMEERTVIILDEKAKPWTRTAEADQKELVQPTIHITRYRTLGTVYVITLLIVIVITSITIRGLWTVFVGVTIIALTVILWAGGWWEIIFEKLGQLSIYINMGGYLLISSVLLGVWLLNFLLFDRQTYMIFTPGQVRIRTEIGGEETVYDTAGMVVQKQRADLFRHWVFGFGSGDLIIKPVGVTDPIEFPNVMLVGPLVTKIETMIKEKVIVGSPEARSTSG